MYKVIKQNSEVVKTNKRRMGHIALTRIPSIWYLGGGGVKCPNLSNTCTVYCKYLVGKAVILLDWEGKYFLGLIQFVLDAHQRNPDVVDHPYTPPHPSQFEGKKL